MHAAAPHVMRRAAALRAALPAAGGAWSGGSSGAPCRAQHSAAPAAPSGAQEDAPPALRDASLLRTHAFVGGEWLSGDAGAPRVHVFNPGAR
jgi:hypothetical protein